MRVITEGANKCKKEKYSLGLYSALSAYWRDRFACSWNATCTVRDTK